MKINYPKRFDERVNNLMNNLEHLVNAKCIGDYNKLFEKFPTEVRNCIATAMIPWDYELYAMQEDRDAWAKRADCAR